MPILCYFQPLIGLDEAQLQPPVHVGQDYLLLDLYRPVWVDAHRPDRSQQPRLRLKNRAPWSSKRTPCVDRTSLRVSQKQTRPRKEVSDSVGGVRSSMIRPEIEVFCFLSSISSQKVRHIEYNSLYLSRCIIVHGFGTGNNI